MPESEIIQKWVVTPTKNTLPAKLKEHDKRAQLEEIGISSKLVELCLQRNIDAESVKKIREKLLQKLEKYPKWYEQAKEMWFLSFGEGLLTVALHSSNRETLFFEKIDLIAKIPGTTDAIDSLLTILQSSKSLSGLGHLVESGVLDWWRESYNIVAIITWMESWSKLSFWEQVRILDSLKKAWIRVDLWDLEWCAIAARNNPKFFEACLEISQDKNIHHIHGLLTRMIEKVRKDKVSTEEAIEIIEKEYLSLTKMNRANYSQYSQEPFSTFSLQESLWINNKRVLTKLQEAGYTTDEIRAIHNLWIIFEVSWGEITHVPPDTVKEYMSVGFSKHEFIDICRLHSRGVSPTWFSELMDMSKGILKHRITDLVVTLTDQESPAWPDAIKNILKIYKELGISEEKHGEIWFDYYIHHWDQLEKDFDTIKKLPDFWKMSYLTLEELSSLRQKWFDPEYFEQKGVLSHALEEIYMINMAKENGWSTDAIVEVLQDVDFDNIFTLFLDPPPSSVAAAKEVAQYGYLARNMVHHLHFFWISAKTTQDYCRGKNGDVFWDQFIMSHLPDDKRQFLEKYNIERPSRYPIEILKKMFALESNEFPRDKWLALIITPKADWNKAFWFLEALTELSRSYVPIIYEVGQDSDVVRACESIEKFGKPIEYLQIGGHGWSGGIEFSDTHDADSADLDFSDKHIFRDVLPFLTPDAVIWLQSCSTGGYRDTPWLKEKYGFSNIAEYISHQLGGRLVIAPNIPTNIDHYELDSQWKVIGIEYFRVNEENKIDDTIEHPWQYIRVKKPK